MSARETSPRLGRGLAALLGDSVAEPVAEIQPARQLPLDKLEPSPFQPRTVMEPGALAELVDSIRACGVLQPILARPIPGQRDRYQIIAGERRWRAAQAAGLHEIPALVRDLSDSEAMAAALVENLQRQDLNAIEEAEGYRRLADEFGMTQEQLGLSVGKSRSHVANAMRLLNLPDSVRVEVRKGTLSAGHARALLAHPEPAKAALAVIARGLNVRQTETLAQQESKPRAESPGRAVDPETRAVEQDLTERLGLRVQIAFDGKGGTLRIQYRTLEQLDGLITLLSRD